MWRKNKKRLVYPPLLKKIIFPGILRITLFDYKYHNKTAILLRNSFGIPLLTADKRAKLLEENDYNILSHILHKFTRDPLFSDTRINPHATAYIEITNVLYQRVISRFMTTFHVLISHQIVIFLGNIVRKARLKSISALAWFLFIFYIRIMKIFRIMMKRMMVIEPVLMDSR